MGRDSTIFILSRMKQRSNKKKAQRQNWEMKFKKKEKKPIRNK